MPHGRICKGRCCCCSIPFFRFELQQKAASSGSAVSESDLILAQITSQTLKDRVAVLVDADDLEGGSLHTDSYLRPNKLFTADANLILYKIGTLKAEKLQEAIQRTLVFSSILNNII